MHKHTKAFIALLSFTGFTALAQGTANDSIKTRLDEVVVTGQIEPQSIKKSVFNVRLITAEDIQRQAGNNLADVLNQYLNIIVMPSNTTGRSSVSMFGLDSRYLKIMVDNVPLVSDEGLGNNVDLTQINLDDVQQIEIIEGAMGVTHGANALSGVINIITKKATKYKWEVNATLQEETIGSEYAFFGDRGRHIQALRAAHTLNSNWFVSVGANRNDFKGYLDQRGGRDYTDYTPGDFEHNRGYSWLPKEQLFTNALVRYQKDNMRIFYKFDFFDEDIAYYNPAVGNVEMDSRIYRVSNDRRYNTKKFYHNLNGVGKIFSKIEYNVSVSHQKQQRDAEQFRYFIQTGQEDNATKGTYQDTEILYSTGTFSNFLNSATADFQLGYEAVNSNGFVSSIDQLFDPNAGGAGQKRRLENYDVFSAAEISLSERFSVRPGARYSFQSKFDNQWAASLGLRQLLNHGLEARASFGRSYRTPEYDELYTYFVDANHNVQGDPNLEPETGYSAEASLKKVAFYASGLQLSNMVTVGYININNRIEQAIVNISPLATKFINIDDYRMWNIATTHHLNFNNWQVKAGASLMGISMQKNSVADQVSGTYVQSDNKFLYTFQANANVGYTVPAWNTVFSVYYKYNGKQRQFIESTTIGEGFLLQEVQPFSIMDASVKKSFWGNRIDATVGARNLFDVVSVRSSVAANSGSHTAGTANMLLAYGRSYFVKLTYNLNF